MQVVGHRQPRANFLRTLACTPLITVPSHPLVQHSAWFFFHLQGSMTGSIQQLQKLTWSRSIDLLGIFKTSSLVYTKSLPSGNTEVRQNQMHTVKCWLSIFKVPPLQNCITQELPNQAKKRDGAHQYCTDSFLLPFWIGFKVRFPIA